mgnify:CR=1 FL=1
MKIRKKRMLHIVFLRFYAAASMPIILVHLELAGTIHIMSDISEGGALGPWILMDIMFFLLLIPVFIKEGEEYDFKRKTFFFEQKLIYYLYKKDPIESFDLIDVEKIERYHNYSLGPVLLKVYTHKNIYYISNDNITGALIYRLTEEEDRDVLFENIEIKDSVLRAGLYRAKGGKTVKRR